MRKRLRRLLRSLRCCKPLSLAAFLLGGALSTNAATIASYDFENPGGYSLSNPGDGSALSEFSDGFGDFAIRTDGSDLGSILEYSGNQGSFWFAVMDLNGEGGPASIRQTFDAVDISGFSNLQLSIAVAEDDDGVNQDWDADSAMKVQYSIDGGAFQNLLAFEAAGGTNTEPLEDTDFDGVGDGTALTPVFADYSKSIPVTGGSLVIRIEYENLESGDEDVAIDNLVISGSPAAVSASAEKAPVSLNATHVNAGDNNSSEFYASGNDDAFSEFGVASFQYSKADFGLANNQDISDITGAQLSVIYNDRSFSDGSGFEIWLTTQEFAGNYSPLGYNASLVNGLDASQFSSAPVSLGTFPFDPAAPGGSTNDFMIDFGAQESAIVDKLNGGGEFSLIITVTNANDDVTFSGLNNNFDPGDPKLSIDVTAVAGSDTDPPMLTTLDPVDDATGASVAGNLVITFNEIVEKGTGNITIHLAANDSVVEAIDVTSGQVTISGASVSIDPSSDLTHETAYYVNIAGPAIADAAGNSIGGISDATTWNFTTEVADVAPIVLAKGPFAVSDRANRGDVVGDVNVDNDGLTDAGVTFSITGVRGGDSMAVGVNGWKVDRIFTVGETFTGTSGALNPSSAGSYTPPGILDGLGAYELDANTVRVFANHELLNFRGYDYLVSDGNGGTFNLDGARVSYFDIDKATRRIKDAGLAYNVIYDANGNVATNNGFLANNFAGLSRFCSAQLVEAHQFGNGRGIENRIFFTGEEDGSFFNSVGGAEWALDPATGNLWQVPAFGRGAWENVTELDTATTTHVAFLLADDSSPFDADGDMADEAAPLFLYVGQKDANGDFLAQNGLRGGKLYVWVSGSGELDPTQFKGSGILQGSWVEVDNTPQVAQAAEDGANGFDEFGFPTQRNLWTQAEALGAFGFSRPEDVATNPGDGSVAVLASTGVDTFVGGVDTFGTIYVVDADFADINAPTASLTILYDGDADTANRALRSPDNLDWADDGFIYVQEDEAEEDTADGLEVLFGPGAVNPNEAGIVRLDPATAEIVRVANIDRGVVLDASIANPIAAIDRDAGLAGEWETSGILDVSTLFSEPAGTLFLFTVQAHGIEDQNTGTPNNAASRIDDNDLVEGGQLAFLSRSPLPAMAEGVNGFSAHALFTVGATVSGPSGDYTPPGILDGLGAYALDADTVRVFANHELLNFRGYDYNVSDGAGGTFSLDGARVSFFDINKTTLDIEDAGPAYNAIYDANGNRATNNAFLSNNRIGFSRFCSAQLVEAHQFGNGRGLEDRIFFTGEEDGSFFDPVGGAEWALDPASGSLWALPDFGRGAWENVTEVDTMTTTHVAFLLADDSSPFDADGDMTDEAAPLYLYVGQKDPNGDFPARNGLRGGQLYVWVSNAGDSDPTQFNGSTSHLRAGTWVAVDNSPQPGQASETGANGFDEFGYPTQRNLWTQAETLGAFGFSRPEDLATNPGDGSQAILASTGVDTFVNGVDTFGTLYVIDTDFTDINAPTAALRILYDGDFDPTRALRSPDNLEWATDGFIYVQEDEAEEDTLDGSEVLFGSGAINPNEAGIVRVDPVTGDTLRVANIDRNVSLDSSISNPFAAIDRDAGGAGEWESSGIIDVSGLFGRQPGELFLFTVQAHGIEDQNTGNPSNTGSRIDDNDLVEGGQLLVLQRAPASAPREPAFRINPNTGVITVLDHNGLDSTTQGFLRLDVAVSDGVFTTPTTVTVAVNNDPVPQADTLRVATFNTSMNRGALGDLVNDLQSLDNNQIASVAEIIQINRPDVILLNEIDFDPRGEALRLFRENYLEVPQNGKQPIYYNYWFIDDSNTGIPSGFDLDNNGTVSTNNNDAFGFGGFPGQYGMAILSRYPIAQDQVRTFQQFLWKDMPNALLPPDPNDSDGNSDTGSYYTSDELGVYRLSSKSHWDVPVWFKGQLVHALASHPTPPVFDDGTETDFNNPTIVDWNGRRNHDEIRFWIDYVDPAASGYIYDDREWAAAGYSTPASPAGGLAAGSHFVILGDQNADPFDGDSTGNPAGQLLASSYVNTSVTPSSTGAPEAATTSGGANSSHTGNPAYDTGDFNDTSPGNLRIDYALPSATLAISEAVVYWPTVADLAANGTPSLLGPSGGASDHRLVYVDVRARSFLQILHASDLEGGVDAIEEAPKFATLVERFRSEAKTAGIPSITLSAGDNYIPGPFFNAAGDFALRAHLQTAYQGLFNESGLNNIRETVGRVDISVMNLIGFDASAVGNHEFDAGEDAFSDIIGTDIRGATLGDVRWLGAQFPYLSANLDFTGGGLSGLFTSDLLPNTAFASTPNDLTAAAAAPKLAPSTMIQIDGDWVGVVGATTPLLQQISSPGNTLVKNPGVGSNDMSALASILQPEIDRLAKGPDGVMGTGDDINKIILVSHLQQISLEQQLIGLLSGVDVIVAGGSDTLLADNDDVLRAGDTAAGDYPLITQNADSEPALIVSTAGQYSYVGRLVVEFDPAGVVIANSVSSSQSGAYATDEAGVLRVTGAGDLASAISQSPIGSRVDALVSAVCGVVTAKDGNVVGRVGVFLEGRRAAVRTEESNMGNLTADANLAAAQAFDATVQVSLKNGGGIRAAIGSVDGLTGALGTTTANAMAGKAAGEVSQLDIENTLRFNNGLTVMTVTAQELKWLLEHGVASTDAAGAATPGQFPQVGGIAFSFDPTRPAIDFNTATGQPSVMGERIRSAAIVDSLGNVSEVLVQDGQLVGDPTREVRIVTLDFLAGIFSAPGDPIGGDGYPFPAFGENVVQLKDTLAAGGSVTFSGPGGEQDALAEYLAANHAAVPYYTSDTPAARDRRIQNLALNGGIDTVLNEVPTGELATTDVGNLSLVGAEISSFDPGSKRLFVTHGGGLQVVDLTDPASPSLITTILPSNDGANGDDVTSVAVGSGVTAGFVAVAVPNATVTENGLVHFYNAADGSFLGAVSVGPLPDAVVFSPDGQFLLSANEGQSAGSENEPGILPNPVGSVSVVTVNTNDPASSTVTTIDFSSLDNEAAALLAKGVRLDPSAPSVGADLEPEYIAIENRTAFITLQENNAVAVIDDIANPTAFDVDHILPLGLKDHTLPFNKLDPSNRDNAINLRNAPVFGMYMPDTIAAYPAAGGVYFVTANEGDGRDVDETRGGSVTLDPVSHPFATALQDDAALGRIKTSNIDGDTDGDGDVDVIHIFGGRSMSIYDAAGNQVFDSGDLVSRVVAAQHPELFNANDGLTTEFDERSDDKGAEPEGLTVTRIADQWYAFLALERASGGLMAFNITDPRDVKFVGYFRVEGDVSPEGVLAIPAIQSPNGQHLLVVTHEDSNNIRVLGLDYNGPNANLPVLRQVVRTVNGSTQIIRIKLGRFSGTPFTSGDLSSYRIQYTVDYQNWTDVSGAMSLENGDIVIEDNVPDNVAFRFYRASN